MVKILRGHNIRQSGHILPGHGAARILTEAITNGTFDTDISGWTNASTGTGSVAWNSGVARLTSFGSAGSDRAIMRQTITVVSGATCRFTYTATNVSHPSTGAGIGTFPGGTNVVNIFSQSNGTISTTFVAPQATLYLSMFGTFPAGTMDVDDVSITY